MVFEPLEPPTTSATKERTDSTYVSSPPRIRRDDEVAAVTGELGSAAATPLVPEFPAATPSPPGPRQRSLFRKQDRATRTVSTKTGGGTVFTFPPQSAPGGGAGEVSRPTASHAVAAPPAVADALAAPPADEPGMLGTLEETIAPTWPDRRPAPVQDVVETDRVGFLDEAERARGAEPVAAPTAEPWLLADPESVAGPDVSPSEHWVDELVPDVPDDAELADVTDEPASDPDDDDPYRQADLEYLLAAQTIDVPPAHFRADQDQTADHPARAERVAVEAPVTHAPPASPTPAPWPPPADEFNEPLDARIDSGAFETAPPVDGSQFFEVLTRDTLWPDDPHSGQHAAEVFAAQTSQLPARTRRGDHVGPFDGVSVVEPAHQLPEKAQAGKKRRRTGRVVMFVLMLLLTLVVVGGGLYVALNTTYL